jgi:hypothetical protein
VSKLNRSDRVANRKKEPSPPGSPSMTGVDVLLLPPEILLGVDGQGTSVRLASIAPALHSEAL